MQREFDLVVECCRASFAGDGRRSDLTGEPDWPLVLRLARRHRVEALVWSSLDALQVSVPSDIAEQLRADAERIAQQNLRIAAECGALDRALSEAAIPRLFVKGLTLAALVYPNPFLKHGWDIDLVVPPEQVPAAAAVLRNAGYGPVLPRTDHLARITRWHRTRKESIWHDAERDLSVELHSRLSDNPRLIPSIGARSPAQMVRIAPGIDLPTLADDELFAYLCVHGASSAWFRLKWITDFAALLHRLGYAGVGRLYEASQGLGAGRSAAQALLLADRLFGLLAGTTLREDLTRDAANRWLADAAYRQLAGPRALTEPTQRPFGTAAIHWSQMLLLPSGRFKASELARQLRYLLP